MKRTDEYNNSVRYVGYSGMYHGYSEGCVVSLVRDPRSLPSYYSRLCPSPCPSCSSWTCRTAVGVHRRWAEGVWPRVLLLHVHARRKDRDDGAAYVCVTRRGPVVVAPPPPRPLLQALRRHRLRSPHCRPRCRSRYRYRYCCYCCLRKGPRSSSSLVCGRCSRLCDCH